MDAPRSGSVVESLLSDTSSSDAAKQCQVQSFCCSARTESSGRGGWPERHVECWQPQKQRLLRETEGVPLVHVENHRLSGRSSKPLFLRFGASTICEPAFLLTSSFRTSQPHPRPLPLPGKAADRWNAPTPPLSFFHLPQIPDTSGFRV